MTSLDQQGQDGTSGPRRRSLLRWLSTALVLGPLAGAYGTLAAFMARFLYPARPTPRAWMFVTELSRLEPGVALHYLTPGGASVSITQQGKANTADAFVALSSTCPHLGCQVNWEAQNERFFCPCHNGVFNPEGVATSGPPAEAGQSLPQYPLKVERGLLYIEVPLGELAQGGEKILRRRRS